MCFDFDEYMSDQNDKFVIENKQFLKKSLLVLYLVLFIYICTIFILYYLML